MCAFTIADYCGREVETESKYLSWLKSGIGETGKIIGSLSTSNFAFAIKQFAIHDNYFNAKQHFYLRARIDEFVVRKYNDSFLEWDIFRPATAILSDNPAIINRYGKLRFMAESQKPSMEELIEKGAIAPMSSLLFAMAEDWEGLEKDLVRIKEKVLTKKKNAYMEPDYAFLLGLLHRNKAEIESSLQEMITPARLKQRHYDPLFAQYLALPAAGYMKLAWIHGFEIKIEHKLLPAELFPVNPNPIYEDTYDFLKELPN